MLELQELKSIKIVLKIIVLGVAIVSTDAQKKLFGVQVKILTILNMKMLLS